MALHLYFLGPPRAELNGAALILQRRKVLALLIYLAISGEDQPRDKLAALLWPEYDQQAARKALRRDLSLLKLALDGEWLVVEGESVGLRDGYWLDVADFQQRAADGVDDPVALAEAIELYRDDFLSGFSLADAPDFDDWQRFQSESLHLALAAALERLTNLLSKQQQYETAIPYARRWLALDPLHEAAQRQLMRLYAQAGQLAAALRQYQACVETLDKELGIPPAAETNALYAQIRSGKLTAMPTRSQAQARHNLPTQTTSLIGRTDEVAEIKRLLLAEPNCRLLNLVGPGGIGKTRLALAAAAQMSTDFRDGVFFVSLAPVNDAADLIMAIAEALRFTFYGNAELKVQLLDYLSDKQLLLVVDNFEHLVKSADLLSEILRHASAVALLATSRERLHLQEEWVYEVRGLPFPADASSVPAQDFGDFGAIQLFTQRAQQAMTSFQPAAAEMVAIVRISQLVEGMPLGLELAAAWIRTLSCSEIAAEIERSLDFLSTTLRNVPERHRSLRVIFEQTWGRLPPAEQAVLMQLSVFRGGCTREAAQQAAGAALPVLSSLVDKALLRRTSLGRYELHELIRQFAAAQLQSDPQALEQALRRHREYFITFLEVHTDGVKGRRQLEALADIEADIDNVRLAWRTAAAKRETAAIERAAECLFVYYLYRNGYDEGLAEFRRAIAAIAQLSYAQADDNQLQKLAVPEQQQVLAGYLLAGLGYFLGHRRNLQKGETLLTHALALLQRSATIERRKVGFAHLWLAWTLYFQGHLTQAQHYARESLAFLTETTDHWGQGWALLVWANCLRDGRPAEAEAIYRRGLALCTQSGDQILSSYFSLNISVAIKALGRYDQAQYYSDQALTINTKLENVLGIGYSSFHKGRLEIAQGKYAQAIQTMQQALICFNKIGTVHASRARIYLGLAYHLHGDLDLAAHAYGQGLDGLKAANSSLDLTSCLNFLGWLAYDQGLLTKAEQLQRQSLALLQQENEPESALLAVTLRHLGQIMVAAGESRYAEARHCFRQALELTLEHQLAPIALDVCVGVAELLVQTGKIEQASELFALAEHHAASTFETRKQARRHLAQLSNQLSAHVLQATQARGQIVDWQQTVRRLVGLL